jgi:DNA-binding XRE family transcriptional regulator
MYAKLFKSTRVKARLNQVEIAEILNCSQGTISKIENGLMKPEVDLYLDFAKKFKFDPLIVTYLSLGEAEENKKKKFKVGDKVFRINSTDKIFPNGMRATIMKINKDEKLAVVQLPDGSQYTASFDNLK